MSFPHLICEYVRTCVRIIIFLYTYVYFTVSECTHPLGWVCFNNGYRIIYVYALRHTYKYIHTYICVPPDAYTYLSMYYVYHPCMYVCICLCTYVRMCVHSVYPCPYTHTYVRMLYLCTYVYTYFLVYVRMCTYVRTYVDMYKCVYVCTYILMCIITSSVCNT